jgi:hypothetical protein
MSALLTGTAKAVVLNEQDNWGWCEYCSVMWWTPGESNSSCPGYNSPDGLHHVSNGSYAYVQYSGSSNPGSPWQPNWRWCKLCQGMFWAGFTGVCNGNPEGGMNGPHNVGTTDYDVEINQSGYTAKSDPQTYWRWCGNCSLLYWQGASGNQAGACPAEENTGGAVGKHLAGSNSVYQVQWSAQYT